MGHHRSCIDGTLAWFSQALHLFLSACINSTWVLCLGCCMYNDSYVNCRDCHLRTGWCQTPLPHKLTIANPDSSGWATVLLQGKFTDGYAQPCFTLPGVLPMWVYVFLPSGEIKTHASVQMLLWKWTLFFLWMERKAHWAFLSYVKLIAGRFLCCLAWSKQMCTTKFDFMVIWSWGLCGGQRLLFLGHGYSGMVYAHCYMLEGLFYFHACDVLCIIGLYLKGSFQACTLPEMTSLHVILKTSI